MKISKVSQKTPLNRFLYWVRERHDIYLRRQAGYPKPWTDDEVLQNYFFTNPYRENDKTTVWFRENVRDSLQHDRRVFMATVIFRWFNRIETGVALANYRPRKGKQYSLGLLEDWNEKEAVSLLRELDPPVFTGAFIIKVGNGPPGSKIPMVCSAISGVLRAQKRLLASCFRDHRLFALWQELKRLRGLGGFMAYEIVCDLRYTYLLKNATDVDTWCNPGPGARRGLNRLLGRRPLGGPVRDVWEKETLKLLKTMRRRLRGMPHFEMREVEHSLCEWDKYERMLWGQGRSKRIYNGRN